MLFSENCPICNKKLILYDIKGHGFTSEFEDLNTYYIAECAKTLLKQTINDQGENDTCFQFAYQHSNRFFRIYYKSQNNNAYVLLLKYQETNYNRDQIIIRNLLNGHEIINTYIISDLIPFNNNIHNKLRNFLLLQ